jgi:hypothetical protein
MVADEEESGTGRGHERDDVHGAQRTPDPRALPLLTRLLHRSVWQSTMALPQAMLGIPTFLGLQFTMPNPQPVLGIRMFLGLPDPHPDPLVTDPAPDPSIIKQKL